MNASVDIVSVLDQAIAREADADQPTVAQFAARAAIVELIEADKAYDLALAALENFYRTVAERGYLAAQIFNARQLGEAFVRADDRRSKALLAVAPIHDGAA